MHLSAAALFTYLLIVANADFNGMRNPSRSRRRNYQHQRNLQTCAERKSKDCINDCEWIKGNCEPAVASSPPAPRPSDGCVAITNAKDCNDAGCSWGGGQTGCMAPAINSVSFAERLINFYWQSYVGTCCVVGRA